jgi:hypothetical protein
MNFVERLGRIDNRIIYTVLIIVLIWPLANPLGLPVSVGANTRRTYEAIDALEAGDVVLFWAGYSASGAGDVQPQAVAIARHLFQQGVKIIFLSDVVEGPMLVENVITNIPEITNQTYGVDWVNLGYLAGGENGISAAAKGLKEAYPLDFRGTPTESIPLLENIETAGDVDMTVFFTTQNSDMYVRQVYPYGKPLIGGLINTIVPQAEPYVNSGQLTGILAGLRGGAEYELLMKQPSLGLAAMDAQSIGHLLFILLIAMANLAYFAQRNRLARKVGE